MMAAGGKCAFMAVGYLLTIELQFLLHVSVLQNIVSHNFDTSVKRKSTIYCLQYILVQQTYLLVPPFKLFCKLFYIQIFYFYHKEYRRYFLSFFFIFYIRDLIRGTTYFLFYIKNYCKYKLNYETDNFFSEVDIFLKLQLGSSIENGVFTHCTEQFFTQNYEIVVSHEVIYSNSLAYIYIYIYIYILN